MRCTCTLLFILTPIMLIHPLIWLLLFCLISFKELSFHGLEFPNTKWHIRKYNKCSHQRGSIMYWHNKLQIVPVENPLDVISRHVDRQHASLSGSDQGHSKANKMPLYDSASAWSNQYPHLSQTQAVYRRQAGRQVDWQINSLWNRKQSRRPATHFDRPSANHGADGQS